MIPRLSDRTFSGLAAVWVAACLILGGASAAGTVANAALEFGAVLIIATSLWSYPVPAAVRGERALFMLLGVLISYIVLTAIPLPSAIWSHLPGRASIAHGYELLGVPPPYLPIALDRLRLMRTVLGLLPVIATYMMVRRLPEAGQILLVRVVVSFAIISIVLGAMQLTGGEASPLRFYETTNTNAPVGFFSNANHLATLILMSMPLAAVAVRRRVGRDSNNASGVAHVSFAALLLMFVVGLVVDRSVAGIGLLLPGLLSSVAVYATIWTGPRWRARWFPILAVVSVFIGIASFIFLSNSGLESKFRETPGSRGLTTPTTLRAAKDFMPVGSGLGTFAQVYSGYEQQQYVAGFYMNHAHDDYAEVALELGVPGLLLMAGFLIWYLWLSYLIWTDTGGCSVAARAASIGIVLVLLHSTVDYPLRTTAISSIFAISCALMVSQRRSHIPGLRVGEGFV